MNGSQRCGGSMLSASFRLSKRYLSRHQDESGKPLNEAQRRRRWLDVSIVLKNNGRAFDADRELLPAATALKFPPLHCTDLTGHDRTFPGDWAAQVKLVTFSFKESGGAMLAGWSGPFRERFPAELVPMPRALAVQLMMVEYGMLSMAKSWFIKGATSSISADQHKNSGFVFGGVKVGLLLFLIET